MSASAPSVLRVPGRIVGLLAACDIALLGFLFAPWQAVVIAVVLGVFALGYRIGRM